jgi:hypothetical protein
MRLRQYGDTGNAAIRLEMVHMDVQQRRLAIAHRIAKRLLHTRNVVEILRVPEIDDQVRASESFAIADDEVVFASAVLVDMYVVGLGMKKIARQLRAGRQMF